MLTSTVEAVSRVDNQRRLSRPLSRPHASMKPRVQIMGLILAAPLLLLACLLFPEHIHAQAAKELSREDIVSLLEAGVASERIESLVQERGTSFELTGAAEQELTRAGASANLIMVIRENYRPPAPSGLITESKPGGATVFVDSQVQVKTSSGGWAKIFPIAPGQHTLRITADGFEDFSREILLKPGETLTVNAMLVRTKAPPPVLVVAFSPAEAAVHVDGKAVGEASGAGRVRISNLEPGKHLVRVSAAGYTDFEQSVQLVSGKETTVTAGLDRQKPSTAGIVLASLPRGASVFVDNALIEKNSPGGNLDVPDLTAGKHQVRVTAEGYAPFEQMVDLGPGSVLTLNVPLAPFVPTVGLVRENPMDGLKYVWIPPGTFPMGCLAKDPDCTDDEKPSHPVEISKGFWLGQTEVTVGAYKRFSSETGRNMPEVPSFGRNPVNPDWSNEQMPMVSVSREDAAAYCGWMGGRLPTEAEWEYAARGGGPEARYGPLDAIAWYADNSGTARIDSERIWREEQGNYTQRLSANANTVHPVAQKQPNAFKLYDMVGNVWEWVNDLYGEKYYSASPARDPKGPTSGEFRVLRGGAWFNGPRVARATARYKNAPNSRGFSLGFRCARDNDP